MLPRFMAIIVAIVGLGLLIAAHEAGHLLLARLMGMRVTTYSLGFGPRIAGFRHGETDYRLSALPLGGYCKIAGFSPEDPAAQDPNDSGSYMNKSAWRRFLVIAAGPGVNYLVAFLIIALLYVSHGFLDLTTTRIEVLRAGRRLSFAVRPDHGTISVKLDHVLVRLPLTRAVPRAIQDVWALNAATLGALFDAVRGKGSASLA